MLQLCLAVIGSNRVFGLHWEWYEQLPIKPVVQHTDEIAQHTDEIAWGLALGRPSATGAGTCMDFVWHECVFLKERVELKGWKENKMASVFAGSWSKSLLLWHFRSSHL